ncbi:MAG: SLC13 family permease, partial [Emcibacter sp.]|nr:SLC13 family permease [Emcibacter sp.]
MQPSIQMWATFGVIIAAIIFYALDRISMEITSLGTISVLLILFHFMPVLDAAGTNILDLKILLAGFADPALITILALLVIGQGMVQTGALETPAQIVVKHGIAYPRRVILACLIAVMVISALLNNTPVVVIFIPIMITLMDKMGKSAGLILMPLSFVAILGGMTTLIGSSTNLLVAGAYKGQTGLDIEFFDFTIPGLFLATLGLIYVIIIAPHILPKKLSPKDEGPLIITGKQFIVQLDLVEGNSLIGKHSVAGMFPDLSRMTVRLVQRGGKMFLPPFDDITFQEGDCIILATTRAILSEKLSRDPTLLKGILTAPNLDNMENEATQDVSRGQKIAEVMVAPASRLDGRTLEQVGYHLQGGCTVLGIQRRSRMIRISMNDIRLEA